MVLGGERSRIPDYRIYRVEDAPELQNVQDALKSKGLKDPWMRNEVWRFLESEWGTHRQRLLKFFFRGFPLGFGAFLATIAFEGAAKLMKGGGGGGGHGGGDDADSIPDDSGVPINDGSDNGGVQNKGIICGGEENNSNGGASVSNGDSGVGYGNINGDGEREYNI